MFYDSNKVQLSTHTSAVKKEDTAAKYRSWGWNVIEIDGNDTDQICSAIEHALEEKKRPTLIIGHPIMAKGVIKADDSSLEGSVAMHGQPITVAGADFDATVENLGGDPQNVFSIRDDVRALFEYRREQLIGIATARKGAEKQWAQEYKFLAQELENWCKGVLPDIDYTAIEYGANEASRNSSAKVLAVLAEKSAT